MSKACKVLGIEVIKAYSPQAKGRVERSHGVYQDRLVKELRLKGIKTIEQANGLLQQGFIDKLNRKFMKSPASLDDAHVSLTKDQNLSDIFCWDYTRTVYNDWIIRFDNQYLQIEQSKLVSVRPKQKIILKKHLDGTITLWLKDKKIPYQFIAQPQKEEKAAKDYSSEQRRQLARRNKHKSPWSQFNPGWLKQTQDHLTAIT